MNKKIIWIIVGLMLVAVFGAVWLQISLIQDSKKVYEQKFENGVIEALNRVAERMDSLEKSQASQQQINGYATLSLFYNNTNDNASLISKLFGKEKNISPEFAVERLQQIVNHIKEKGQDEWSSLNMDEDLLNWIANMSSNESYVGIPLEERLSNVVLDSALREELHKQGIQTPYRYGVFSFAKRSFIIVDGYYMIQTGQEAKKLFAGNKDIYQSRYKSLLFPSGASTPGQLMIFFPARTQFVWRNLWANLLGTILFSLIVIGCFTYTVWTIFRQKKVSEMKTDFINNMTHEFKTPIATISLAADSIMSPLVTGHSEKVKRFADIIKQENKRMNNQVEKVLQMALIDRKEFSLKLVEVNLHDVIGSAIENINLQLEKKGGSAKARLEATRPVVEGDYTHISNIINNLLDNANKYTPENPDLEVSTRNVEEGVEVIVKDNGIGMSKETRKHIFDKFYRVHTGNLHDVKGFGLGLSYVKAMMLEHKGTVDVKSEIGKGSSFILTFPFEVKTGIKYGK